MHNLGTIRQGVVLGAELAKPVSGAKINLLDNTKKILASTITGERGEWQLRLIDGVTTIEIRAKGYVTKHIAAETHCKINRILEDTLIGYQQKLYFTPGENVSVYVHSPTRYHAQLFRHGFKKQLIMGFGQYPPKSQTVPDGFFVDNGLNWNIAFKYVVPDNARPGLYSILLTSTKKQSFAIPMVISTPLERMKQKGRILVLASTNTWQSYNTWGGRSRYRNFEEQLSGDFIDERLSILNTLRHSTIAHSLPTWLIKTIRWCLRKKSINTKDWVYKKLSTNRPFVNCNLEGDNAIEPFSNHLAGGEWRVLAWLEREGIDYDFVSGHELHKTPSILNNYKAVIFSTHCEYWSKMMYEGVKQHHEENGLWLINLSGNTMFREINFFSDGSHHCASLSFADSVADESQLLGVRFSMSDYATCARYKIVDLEHWAFEGAPVNTKAPWFGGLSLNQNTRNKSTRYDPGRPGTLFGLQGQGASGWETDKRTRTAPKDMLLIAKGENKHGGADMLIREPNGTRGGMFTASSLTFGGCLLIDAVASRLTKNIITRALSN